MSTHVVKNTPVITTQSPVVTRASGSAESQTEVRKTVSRMVPATDWSGTIIRSRSISPQRNYTPRRGRPIRVTTTTTRPAISQSFQVGVDSTLPKEYWTYCTPGEAKVSTRIGAASAAATTTQSTSRWTEASTSWTRAATEARSRSAEEALHHSAVECCAIFVQQGRTWRFSLRPEVSVQDAISKATRHVLQAVAEKDRRLGESLSINTVPAITEQSTVGEWCHRNLDQPPVIVIKSGYADSVSLQGPDSDSQNFQRLLEEQNRLLLALQKQLVEQTAVIQNQAGLIAELRSKDSQESGATAEALARIEGRLATMSGQLLQMEERVKSSGVENASRKGVQKVSSKTLLES